VGAISYATYILFPGMAVCGDLRWRGSALWGLLAVVIEAYGAYRHGSDQYKEEPTSRSEEKCQDQARRDQIMWDADSLGARTSQRPTKRSKAK